MLYYLLLLLLASSLIECKPTGGGGGCASCGGGKGGGGKGGGGGGGGGKGGGGGGKGGGGGGKGGGGGGKKGLYGNWVRPQTALPASEEDYRAAYGELYHQDPWAYNPYRQDGYGAERKYGQVVNKPDYSRPYYPANRPYYKVPQASYGKGFGEDYGKSYPVTQGWYGSYDKGWQGSGGPSGYFRGTDYGTSGTEGDDRTALYVRKGLQDYQGVAGYRDQPERTR